MIKELRLAYCVALLCHVLEVTTSGYYAWVKRPLTIGQREEMRLELEIRAAHKRTHQTYGPERLQRDLADNGVVVGVHRINCRYATRKEAIQNITEYIEVFYNRQRKQARLGFLSPAAFERWFYEKRLAA